MKPLFFEYLRKAGILEDLKSDFKINPEDIPYYQRILSNLKDKHETTTLNNEYSRTSKRDIDYIGFVYQKIITKSERKKTGEFYTPIPIINYILDRLKFNSSKKIEKNRIIDPSCGCGSFLIQVIKRLIQRFADLFNVMEIKKFSISQAKKIIEEIQNHVFGIDLNPLACFLCSLNIYYALFDLISIILKSEPDYKPGKFQIHNINAIKLLDTKSFKLPGQGFDIVLGNPPYIFIRQIPTPHKKLIETLDFQTNQGQYDYYQIFLELGIKLLKQGGKLGFILPDSLLALSNRKIIRKYIMETTKIKEINHVGEKFENLNVSNIILILEKEQSDKGRFHNYVKIKTPKHEIKLQQWRFKEWNYKFLINLNETDISILAYLNDNFPKLGELNENYRIDMKIQRGVEIGKDGTVFYCSQCKKYYPLPSRRRDLICKVCKTPFQESHIESIVFDEKPKNSEAEFVPFIYTISRYQINQRKYITTSKQGINYKSFDLYQDRILIRQISEDNKICATYDRGLSLTTQSIYNLKIKQYENNHLFNSYYLLGLLNSELLSYYFIKSFGSYKLLFPRILIEKIRQLPILIPETQKEKKIAEKLSKCVKEVLELSDNNKGSRDYQKKLNLIDELTYELFSIQKKTYIHSFFLK